MTVLDGGLATSLEALGYDLADDLWSAKTLLEDPDAIRRVHIDFLMAGADCITAAT
ncbi:MAG: homocysteine S-methyltransferase family protein, partial [Acidimicrobiales bacterium]|nr:homocysteine S-methyltransferase family protein [Acidimicrobiales bacterium]